MKTPEQILDEVAAENMINIQQMVQTKYMAIIAMRRYAELYHESEVEKLNILRVSNSVCGSINHKMMLAGIYKECPACGEKFEETDC